LPELPCIAGRDLAGKIVIPPSTRSRFKKGENVCKMCQNYIYKSLLTSAKVMAVSTDYRDSRKSAYQQYAVVSDFNACRLPSNMSGKEAAPLGVAFVAAALGLGICMGMDFLVAADEPRGPNLLRTIRALSRDSIPQDIRTECFDGIKQSEGAKSGDWIAIWGGKALLEQHEQT
jgi:NADPH:quinone reductase-like Zn-dependent oxidoreductase